MPLKDFFNRVTIEQPKETLLCEKCIFTVISPGYENLLDDMLSSIEINGQVPDAQKVVYVVNPDEKCLDVIKKHNAYPIFCHTEKNTNIDTKSVVYTIMDLVACNKYLYLDADVFVLHSLEPLFNMVDMIPKDAICMCRDQYFGWANNLCEAYTGTLYNGNESDFEYLLGRDAVKEKSYSNIVNAGIFVCGEAGLKRLHQTILSFKHISDWAKDGFIREQFVVNLSLALNDNLIVLDPIYNWQIAVRTALKYKKYDDKFIDVIVAYNPFFLDYLFDPVSIFKDLNDTQDEMSVYLKNKIIDKGHRQLLDNIETLHCSRLEFIKILEDILNGLIIQTDLFNDEFLLKFWIDVSLDEITEYPMRIRANKDIINYYYFGDLYQCNEFYIEHPISILHFNGQYKDAGNIRNFLKTQMTLIPKNNFNCKTNSGIKIAISTHKNYKDLTLPRLLKSLIELNQISPENILVVCGGYNSEKTYIEDGVLYHCVTHNSFDHTALVDIIEKNIKSNFWFLLQDTCEVGSQFYDILLNHKKSHDYIAVDGQGYLNMGLFSWNFLKSIERYILKLKNCGKEKAMLSEKVFMGLGKSIGFGDIQPIFVGYGDIYDTGTLRNICYYKSIDLYKYQANMSDDMRICKV